MMSSRDTRLSAKHHLRRRLMSQHSLSMWSFHKRIQACEISVLAWLAYLSILVQRTPRPIFPLQRADSEMSSGWEVRMSNSKKLPYFFNTETKESRWEAPQGLTEQDIQTLPGAREYLNATQADHPSAGQIRASHLLVKHRGSRRPSSWKEPNITRTKEEAIAILEKYQREIQAASNKAEKFGELAREHSDCSSHSADGDLGHFGRNQMQKPFEDAAFALQVKEISGIVSTDSGVHLIMRTA
ncbi:hypothetical protein M404DRAFT_422436 [Pisolithus tinctorius Marx 270]|uniref:Peptidyl-prolyl cis-trans isomerase n=1 Tax=Pisolithus tinctorius Marx 270 TaxID=870435 RepID=A0A0C3KBG4_PISTI|nr:hypothetical protein M404DRAFT_422436 [Pisolithus tinctorius Marx 270]